MFAVFQSLERVNQASVGVPHPTPVPKLQPALASLGAWAMPSSQRQCRAPMSLESSGRAGRKRKWCDVGMFPLQRAWFPVRAVGDVRAAIANRQCPSANREISWAFETSRLKKTKKYDAGTGRLAHHTFFSPRPRSRPCPAALPALSFCGTQANLQCSTEAGPCWGVGAAQGWRVCVRRRPRHRCIRDGHGAINLHPHLAIPVAARGHITHITHNSRPRASSRPSPRPAPLRTACAARYIPSRHCIRQVSQ